MKRESTKKAAPRPAHRTSCDERSCDQMKQYFWRQNWFSAENSHLSSHCCTSNWPHISFLLDSHFPTWLLGDGMEAHGHATRLGMTPQISLIAFTLGPPPQTFPMAKPQWGAPTKERIAHPYVTWSSRWFREGRPRYDFIPELQLSCDKLEGQVVFENLVKRGSNMVIPSRNANSHEKNGRSFCHLQNDRKNKEARLALLAFPLAASPSPSLTLTGSSLQRRKTVPDEKAPRTGLYRQQ